MRDLAHHPDDDPAREPDRRFALEVAALLVLMAVAFIVMAVAVQACT